MNPTNLCFRFPFACQWKTAVAQTDCPIVVYAVADNKVGECLNVDLNSVSFFVRPAGCYSWAPVVLPCLTLENWIQSLIIFRAENKTGWWCVSAGMRRQPGIGLLDKMKDE